MPAGRQSSHGGAPTDIEIIPSILSADFARLGEQVAEARAAGIRKIQVDVMDGHFVPNITVGPPVVAALRRATDVALDVHLMIESPEAYVDAFADAGADVLTVHAEASRHLHRVVQHIKRRGLLAGVALNPGTPLEALDELLPLLDVALVMTVDPGFGGQAFIPEMTDKVRRLGVRLATAGPGHRPTIQVDGGIDATTAPLVVAAGARQLVAGSAVFSSGGTVAEAVARLTRAAAEGAAGD